MRIISLALITFVFTGLSYADRIALKDGSVRDGTVVAVEDKGLRFQVGPAKTLIPMDRIASVEMDPPEAYTEAIEKWSGGDQQSALSLLEPVVSRFRGLPIPWAELASAQLGDLYLANDKMEEAKEAFTAFQRAYPDAKNLATVGLARLALERGEAGVAKIQITPVVETARKKLAPEGAEGPGFAQACYIMGRALEEEGNLPEALENFLLVQTVYYQDPSTLKLSQQRAQALIDQGVRVP